MYTLPELEYKYDALEPYIDKETMVIHHTKHHQTYLNNLNEILSAQPELTNNGLESLLKNPTDIPSEIRTKTINNGGGFFNHNLYWKTLNPKKSMPGEKFLNALNSTFGSLDVFKEKLSNISLTHFGSGWGWLVLNSGKLEIISTANQNSPLSEGKIPILGIDVWEHAYYLKYQNKRADYIAAIWNIINWDYLTLLFDKES